MCAAFRHALPFGAEIAEEGTRFRLWAPQQEQMSLVLGEQVYPMRKEPDGWFAFTARAPAGARYRYQLGDGTRIPDPASRFQPDDVHGPSEVIDPTAYTWQHTAWRGRP